MYVGVLLISSKLGRAPDNLRDVRRSLKSPEEGQIGVEPWTSCVEFLCLFGDHLRGLGEVIRAGGKRVSLLGRPSTYYKVCQMMKEELEELERTVESPCNSG